MVNNLYPVEHKRKTFFIFFLVFVFIVLIYSQK